MISKAYIKSLNHCCGWCSWVQDIATFQKCCHLCGCVATTASTSHRRWREKAVRHESEKRSQLWTMDYESHVIFNIHSFIWLYWLMTYYNHNYNYMPCNMISICQYCISFEQIHKLQMLQKTLKKGTPKWYARVILWELQLRTLLPGWCRRPSRGRTSLYSGIPAKVREWSEALANLTANLMDEAQDLTVKTWPTHMFSLWLS